MPNPTIDTHVHFFTADHAPEIQLYYLIHAALCHAIDEVVPGDQHVERAKFVRILDRFNEPYPSLMDSVLIPLADAVPGLLRPEIKGMVRTFQATSKAPRGAIREVLGEPAEGPTTGSGFLRGLRSRIRSAKDSPDPARKEKPFRAALADIVKELYAVHRGAEKITQADVYQAFLQNGGNQFDKVVALSINFDQAFQSKEIMGLQKRPAIGFENQARELLDLATAKQGRIVPFLCLDPRVKATADALVTYVRDWIDAGFKGVKFYPPMGNDAGADILQPVWDYCQDHRIPVISHCAQGGAGIRDESGPGNLANPGYWFRTLSRLADRWEVNQDGEFRLCLAHFSALEHPDDESWSDDIMRMMQRLDRAGVRLYADLAYAKPGQRRDLKRFAANVTKIRNLGLMPNVLYGSDWWNFYPHYESVAEFLSALRFDQEQPWFDAQQLDNNARRFLAE